MGGLFVHLHVHSEYSLLHSTARIKELVNRAKVYGMKALAITDLSVMYGVIPFYKACVQQGIKPIIGCEMHVKRGSIMLPRGLHHALGQIVLLAENVQGYKNLIQLTTKAHLESGTGVPCIQEQWLRQYGDGLIALSSCLRVETSKSSPNGRLTSARRYMEEYADLFGDRFFLELQGQDMEISEPLIALAKGMGVGLVATHPVRYIDPKDAAAYDIHCRIGTGDKITREGREKSTGDGFHLKSPQEMQELFSHIPEALLNTVRIADRCQLKIPFGKPRLPAFDVPPMITSTAYLRKQCEQGARERYGVLSDEVRQRLDRELSVIDRMGLSDYFLVVWDFVRFAREQQIVMGPGRGSSTGSIVCYVLYITHVDPIRYQLLFERFLNPERVHMPDIDIDFDYERRDEVIQYVTEKYGKDHVAQIVTFGTMARRAVLRDVGRVLQIPQKILNHIVKAIVSGDREALADLHPKTGLLLDTIQKLEGLPRHISTHAAGVVISKEALTECVPLQKGNADVPLTQYPMEDLQEIGLLKIDFLGLRILTVIQRTLEMIERHIGTKVTFVEGEYEDPATYRLLSNGDTSGVFQLDSAGMRKVLVELKPSTFEEIVAIVALYRPGPMQQIPVYIQAKYGLKEVNYPHQDLEEILSATYGVIIYQEQIMQIAQKMAGFTLGQADKLQRAIAKKDYEGLAQQQVLFIQGCTQQGYDETVARRVYQFIERFAKYGFNRSHSVAYGVLAYQTAFLKANYPAFFMTALLNSVMGDVVKTREYIDEIRGMGLPLLPPDIHKSGYAFTVEDGGIRFGLGSIRNVGVHVVQLLLEERDRAPFIDLYDLYQRVDRRVCNKRVMESLILCGALDSLPGHRAYKMAMLDQVGEQGNIDPESVQCYSLMKQLEDEREYLGYCLSGHPLDAFNEALAARGRVMIQQLQHRSQDNQNQTVYVAGIVREVKTITAKTGSPMAFVMLEDQSGVQEMTVFPEMFQRYSDILSVDYMLFVSGVLQEYKGKTRLLANRIQDLHQWLSDDVYAMIRILPAHENPQTMQKLKKCLLSFPGPLSVRLRYESRQKAIVLPIEKYGISATPECMEQMESLLGEGAIQLVAEVPGKRKGAYSNSTNEKGR